MNLLTIDFGGTFVKYAMMDADGNLSENDKVPAPLESLEQFVRTVEKIYEPFKGRVGGIAISMPGIIDSDNGYVRTAGAYNGTLAGINVIDVLKDVVDVPVAVENDGKAAILAELWKGSLQGVNTAAACIVGSGLGGGIIMDGKLRKGSHFASGEISGLMTQSGNYEMHGAAASVASMTAFLMRVAYAKQMDPKLFEVSGANTGDNVDENVKRISGIEVFNWIEQGDEITIGVYQQWLRDLTMVLYNMKMTLDPEKIVVGGGVSRNPRFIQDLKAEFEKSMKTVLQFGFPACELDVCQFTSDANLIGAAYNWMLHNNFYE